MSQLSVVVGRFQVDYLTLGHQVLLRTANNTSNGNLLVFLACCQKDYRNPLDYRTRIDVISSFFSEKMLADPYFAAIWDHPSDEVWSKSLDRDIETFTRGGGVNAVIYTGRDSLKDTYKGKYPIEFIDTMESCSGSGTRAEIARNPKMPMDFMEFANQKAIETRAFARGQIYLNEQLHSLGLSIERKII